MSSRTNTANLIVKMRSFAASFPSFLAFNQSDKFFHMLPLSHWIKKLFYLFSINSVQQNLLHIYFTCLQSFDEDCQLISNSFGGLAERCLGRFHRLKGQDLNTLFKISFGGKKFFHERVFRDLALLKRGPEMILPLNEIKSFDIIKNKSNLGK